MTVSITDDGARVYLFCAGQGAAGSTIKYVFRAGITGAGWTLVGNPPRTGDAGELSAGSDRALLIATSSGASWLCVGAADDSDRCSCLPDPSSRQRALNLGESRCFHEAAEIRSPARGLVEASPSVPRGSEAVVTISWLARRQSRCPYAA
jgi:hypothetical protein